MVEMILTTFFHTEIPQYSPGAAYRLLELLLGRVQNVTEPGDFTTLPGDFYVGGA